MEPEEKKQMSEEEKTPQIHMKRVGALMQAIIQRKTTVPRFRFNLTEQDALDLLASHYGSIVATRHGTPVFDVNTVRNLRALANYLTQEVPKFGVMMCGSCGNGKTTLLYTLQSAINHLNSLDHFKFLKDYFKVGLPIYDAREILIMAKDLKELRLLRERPMLAIDDLGKEPTEVLDYGNVTSPVVELLEYRYQHQLFTAITTNLNDKDLKKKYGSRINDRFNEMLQVIVFQSISYRH